MRTITKEFKRDMAHRLPDYEGKCFNVHWHTYKAQITLKSKNLREDDKDWMVEDFNLLKVIKEWVDDNRDHSYVWRYDDDVLIYLSNCWYRTYTLEESPTAENMAKFLYEVCEELIDTETYIDSVTIYETPTSFTTYRK